MDPIALLDACEHCYSYPMHTAGPDGRDGCTITQIQGRTVVVFRGTVVTGAVGVIDWLNDLRAALIWRPEFPGHVHHGFAASLADLLPWLERYDLKDGTIFCGHSKGGALAILAGHLYRDLDPLVVSFAAPMVGDRGFLAGYRVRATCYENPHDIVPKLPPFGYRSIGDLIGPGIDWQPPHGIEANHALETGYRPWIEKELRPTAAAA